MIPKPTIIKIAEEEQHITSRTFKFNFESNRIGGIIDGITAVQQEVSLILNTERYAYLAQTWDFGVGLEKYIGQEYDYIVASIQEDIIQGLKQDNRVLEVVNFEFEQIDMNSISIKFDVNTDAGVLNIEKEVRI